MRASVASPQIQALTQSAEAVCAKLYIRLVRFEWDEKKNQATSSNTARFSNRPIDLRWHAIGFAEKLILLIVVHTDRDAGTGELIRIISARQATRHERKLYEATHR
jgi:uncharacterized protein